MSAVKTGAVERIIIHNTCKYISTHATQRFCVSAYTNENSSHVERIKYLINKDLFYTFGAVSTSPCTVFGVINIQFVLHCRWASVIATWTLAQMKRAGGMKQRAVHGKNKR